MTAAWLGNLQFEFLPGGVHPCQDFFLRFGVPPPEPFLQFLYAGRSDEDADTLEVALGHRLHSLHIDVQDARLAFPRHRRHGLEARAVNVFIHRGVLEEFTVRNALPHDVPSHEVVMHAILSQTKG